MSNKLAEAIQEQIDQALYEVRETSRQAIEEERARLAQEEADRKAEEQAKIEAEKAKRDIFDDLDVFDITEEHAFKPYVAPPRVELLMTDEIKALIQAQVAMGIAQAIKTLTPETKIIEKTINNPTKVVVKELVDNTDEILKKVEKKIRKEIDDLDRSGRFGPIVVPSPIADQNGHAGQVLSTNGSTTRWIDAPASSTPSSASGGAYSGVVLTDSGGNMWRGVPDPVTGAFDTSLVTSVPSGSFKPNQWVMRDASGTYWTFTINTSGALVSTLGGTFAQSIDRLVVVDSAGVTWVFTVTEGGALETE